MRIFCEWNKKKINECYKHQMKPNWMGNKSNIDKNTTLSCKCQWFPVWKKMQKSVRSTKFISQFSLSMLISSGPALWVKNLFKLLLNFILLKTCEHRQVARHDDGVAENLIRTVAISFWSHIIFINCENPHHWISHSLNGLIAFSV